MLNPLNETMANWPFNKITFFSEVIGFKETFRLKPLFYPLPSHETVVLIKGYLGDGKLF